MEGISALRDESGKDGMRIVIEVKRDAVGEVVLNNLYSQTQLLEFHFPVLLMGGAASRPNRRSR